MSITFNVPLTPESVLLAACQSGHVVSVKLACVVKLMNVFSEFAGVLSVCFVFLSCKAVSSPGLCS